MKRDRNERQKFAIYIANGLRCGMEYDDAYPAETFYGEKMDGQKEFNGTKHVMNFIKKVFKDYVLIDWGTLENGTPVAIIAPREEYNYYSVAEDMFCNSPYTKQYLMGQLF